MIPLVRMLDTAIRDMMVEKVMLMQRARETTMSAKMSERYLGRMGLFEWDGVSLWAEIVSFL
jgi:hypothetical protein